MIYKRGVYKAQGSNRCLIIWNNRDHKNKQKVSWLLPVSGQSPPYTSYVYVGGFKFMFPMELLK